jgi:Prealbumin-like fold domain
MDTNIRRPKRATTFRRAGWLAVASMVGLALAGPGTGIANATVPVTTYCINVLKTGVRPDLSTFPISGVGFTVDSVPSGVKGLPFTTTTGDGSTGSFALGTIEFCNLPAGDYVVTESGPPTWMQGAAPQDVTVPSTGTAGAANLTFVDHGFCINILKTDQDGTPMSGVEFGLTDPTNPGWAGGNPDGWTQVTDAKGKISYCELNGSSGYVVTEISPPAGYTGAAPQPITLPTSAPGGDAYLPFVDTLISSYVAPVITPLCADTPGEYRWSITLASDEPDYDLEMSSDATDANAAWWPILMDMGPGDNLFGPTEVNTIWVRWVSDPSSIAGPVTNPGTPCTAKVPIFQKVIASGNATFSDFTFTITQGTTVTTVPGSALDPSTGIYSAPKLVGAYTVKETQAPPGYAARYDLGGVENWTGCSWPPPTAVTPPLFCVITNFFAPVPQVATTCGGTVTFTDALWPDQTYKLIIAGPTGLTQSYTVPENGPNDPTTGVVGPLTESPGKYTYLFTGDNGAIPYRGSFTIAECAPTKATVYLEKNIYGGGPLGPMDVSLTIANDTGYTQTVKPDTAITTVDPGGFDCVDPTTPPIGACAYTGTPLLVDPGSYTISEPSTLTGYTVSSNRCKIVGDGFTDKIPHGWSSFTASFEAGVTYVCYFTNDYAPPVAFLQKVIVGGDATFKDFAFTIHWAGVGGPPDLVIPGSALDPEGIVRTNAGDGPIDGEYTITETTSPSNYVVSYDNGRVTSTGCHWVPDPPGVVQTTPPICVITNTYVPPTATGTITFVKVINGVNKGPVALTDFTFRYVGANAIPLPSFGTAKNGDVKTLPFRTYAISEVTPLPANYLLDSVACVPTVVGAVIAPTTSAVLNADHPIWTCTITNHYSRPPLAQFQKVIVGGTATYADFTFKIFDIEVPGSGLDANGIWWLPEQALVQPYTITETGKPANYVVSYSGCTDATPAAKAPCVITNTYSPPPPPPPPTPVVSTACGGSVTFTNVLAGWTYRIDSTTGTATAATTTSVGPLAEGLGLHTYQFMNAAGAIVASGSFTIVACSVSIPGPNPVSPSPSPSPSASPSVSPSPTPAATATPNTGGVAGATGKPHVTPPPTDALGIPTGQPAGDTWRFALLGLAALLASLLIFSPSKTSPERRRR